MVYKASENPSILFILMLRFPSRWVQDLSRMVIWLKAKIPSRIKIKTLIQASICILSKSNVQHLGYWLYSFYDTGLHLWPSLSLVGHFQVMPSIDWEVVEMTNSSYGTKRGKQGIWFFTWKQISPIIALCGQIMTNLRTKNNTWSWQSSGKGPGIEVTWKIIASL